MEKKNDLREKMLPYLLFSLIFWAFVLPILYSIFKSGSVTTACLDAITQMYPTMLYVSRLLRSFIGAIFTGKTFTFPMLEWNLGMGENTIGVLNWHGFGDPFYLLTVFASDESLPYWYSFIMYLKIYASGIAFIAMAREMSKDKSCYAYIIGAFLYCFCGFTQISNMHVIFLHALVYTPLMVMAAHKHIYNTEYKWGLLLTFSTMCFAMSGFYFLYIASVSLAVYTLYQLYRKRASIKELVTIVLRLIGEYLLGIGLAAVILIPGIIWFLSSDRAGVSQNISLIDSWGDMLKRIANVVLPQYNGEQVLSISAVGIVCLLLVFARRRKREIANLLLLFVLTCIPIISCVMSGFGEIYDRWEYVIVLYWAFLTVEIWDEIKSTTVFEVGFLLFFDAALYALGRKLDWDDTYHFVFSFRLLTVMVMCVVLYRIFMISRSKIVRNAAELAMFAVAVVIVCMTWKEVKGEREIENVTYRNVIAELLPNEKNEEFYRIEYEKTFAEPRLGMNLSLVLQFPGVSEYFSMTNNAYFNAFPTWGAARAGHNIGGLNYRSILETLCGVKYYIGYSDNPLIVPYGFEEISKTSDGEYTLYENRYALPLAYTYEKMYQADVYDSLEALEKQQVMLQAAVLKGYDGDISCMDEYKNNILDSEYEIVSMDGVTVDDASNAIEVVGGV